MHEHTGDGWRSDRLSAARGCEHSGIGIDPSLFPQYFGGYVAHARNMRAQHYMTAIFGAKGGTDLCKCMRCIKGTILMASSGQDETAEAPPIVTVLIVPGWIILN